MLQGVDGETTVVDYVFMDERLKGLAPSSL